MAEAQEFVDHLYGRDNIVSDRHFTVREDTEVADNFVCNNNSDCEDVKLEPYEIYDQGIRNKYIFWVKIMTISTFYFINYVNFVN